MNTIKIEEDSGGIVVYEDERMNLELKTDIEKETIWATQSQISDLFGIDRTVVSKHIQNIIITQEISRINNVQKMHIVNSLRPVAFYSLDMILSIGYRVNSKKATKFRIWANKVLRDYILKGIAVNDDRIEKLHEKGITDLKEKLAFIQNTVKRRELDRGEVDSLLSVINDYANSWLLLKKYDDGEVTIRKTKSKETVSIGYLSARASLDALRASLVEKGEAGDLFAKERDESFQGILKTIYQTYGGEELYPSIEEKASHLLYFIIKDHPFFDGNKRSGALLFIFFLEQNGILRGFDGQRKISDNALVAIALLVAESNPKEKDVMVALVTHLIS
ncbi:MAG: virulence protein RhuM/Fic/DOC family protein [Candidatus Paceibacterota bacterium]|jgi:prophage maintenance system killer protein